MYVNGMALVLHNVVLTHTHALTHIDTLAFVHAHTHTHTHTHPHVSLHRCMLGYTTCRTTRRHGRLCPKSMIPSPTHKYSNKASADAD